jgi:uncharacterized membrane protein
MYVAAETVHWGGGLEVGVFPNTTVYPPAFYTPSVLAIWFGKLLHMRILRTLYLARLATGVASVLVGVCAIALGGAAAPWLFLVMSFPIAEAQMASPSQDGLMIAVAALAAALLLDALRGGRALTCGRYALACACIALVAAARPPYVAMVIVLLLPSGPPLGTRLVGASAVLGVVLAWAALAAVNAAVVFRLDLPPGQFPDPTAQLLGMIESPLRFPTVLAETFRLWSVEFARQIVGVLGGLDVDLPHWFTILAWCLIPVAAVASIPPATPRTRRVQVASACLLGIVISGIGVFLIQYLTWTPVGSTSVQGVQGRYFLPLMIFAVGVITLHRSGADAFAQRLRLAALIPIGLFPVVALTVTMRSIVLHYYL